METCTAQTAAHRYSRAAALIAAGVIAALVMSFPALAGTASRRKAPAGARAIAPGKDDDGPIRLH
jgi:hypothetical protein